MQINQNWQECSTGEKCRNSGSVLVSKREAIFHPPRMEKEENANAIFRPCERKSMCSNHDRKSLTQPTYSSTLLCIVWSLLPFNFQKFTLIRDNVLRLAKLYFFAKQSKYLCFSAFPNLRKMGTFAASVERP